MFSSHFIFILHSLPPCIWPLWDVIFLKIPLISNNVLENSIPKVTILVIILISSPGPIPPLTDNIAAQLSHSRILHYSTINFLRNHAASPYSRGSKLGVKLQKNSPKIYYIKNHIQSVPKMFLFEMGDLLWAVLGSNAKQIHYFVSKRYQIFLSKP